MQAINLEEVNLKEECAQCEKLKETQKSIQDEDEDLNDEDKEEINYLVFESLIDSR